MIVRNAEVPGGGGLFRRILFRPVKAQGLKDHIVGQAVFVRRIDGCRSRCWRGFRSRGLLLGSFRREETGVALIVAHGILKEVPVDRLVAPGVGAGVNADIYLSDVADCAVDLVISIGKGHFVAHLIVQPPLQLHRFPPERFMGEAVQLLLVHRPEDGRDRLPGTGLLCAEFILDFYRHTGGGGKIIRDIPGLQRYRTVPAGKCLRKPHGKPTVVLPGVNPAGNVVLVPVRQQMGGQDFPKIIVDAPQIGGQVAGDPVIPGIPMQQPLKVFLAHTSENGVAQRGVEHLHIKQANPGDLKGSIFKIDRIAHFVGRCQRVMGRLGGTVWNDNPLLPGLGEDRIGFVQYLFVQALLELRHIIIRPHKIRFFDGDRGPFDRFAALKQREVLIAVLAGVLIGRIRQHQLLDHGLILLIDFPNFWCCRFLRLFLLVGDPLHIGHDLPDKGAFLAAFQSLPDGHGVNIIKIVPFLLGVELVILDKLGNPPLHLGPGEVGASSWDRERGEVIPVFAFQPCRRALVAGVVFHIADNGVLTGNVPVPLLERRVNGLLGGAGRGGRFRLGGLRHWRGFRFHGSLFQVVTPVLLHLCLGEVAALRNHFMNPLLHLRPSDDEFLVRGLAPELHAGAGPVVQKAASAI